MNAIAPSSFSPDLPLSRQALSQRVVDDVLDGADVLLVVEPATGHALMDDAARYLARTGAYSIRLTGVAPGGISLAKLREQIAAQSTPALHGRDRAVGGQVRRGAGRVALLVSNAETLHRDALRHIQRMSQDTPSLRLAFAGTPAMLAMLDVPAFAPLQQRLQRAARHTAVPDAGQAPRTATPATSPTQGQLAEGLAALVALGPLASRTPRGRPSFLIPVIGAAAATILLAGLVYSAERPAQGPAAIGTQATTSAPVGPEPALAPPLAVSVVPAEPLPVTPQVAPPVQPTVPPVETPAEATTVPAPASSATEPPRPPVEAMPPQPDPAALPLPTASVAQSVPRPPQHREQQRRDLASRRATPVPQRPSADRGALPPGWYAPYPGAPPVSVPTPPYPYADRPYPNQRYLQYDRADGYSPYGQRYRSDGWDR